MNETEDRRPNRFTSLSETRFQALLLLAVTKKIVKIDKKLD